MLSVIVPTYNERENLPKLLSELFRLGIAVDVIVVDDNSPDGTGQLAEKLKKRYPLLHVLHRTSRGRGTAGIAGFLHALSLKNRYVMEMDADFSHDPRDIPAFLKSMKSADVVIGSRYVGGRILDRSIYRNIISSVANVYNRIFLGLHVRDVSSGFKCYRREVIKALDFPSFVSRGYSIGAETLFRVARLGFTMEEIPITFRNRKFGASKCDTKEKVDYVVRIMQIRLRGLSAC